MFNVTLSDKERCLKDAMIVNSGQPIPPRIERSGYSISPPADGSSSFI